MNDIGVNLIVTDFGTYLCPKEIFILNSDRRTREGKMKARYINALMALDDIAWHLGLEGVHAILPKK